MEVLGTFVPEEEASRMANGKYACLVCPSRPVFPTMPALAVHRSGKRHKEHAATFKERKVELQNLKEKRELDAMLKQNAIKKVSGFINYALRH